MRILNWLWKYFEETIMVVCLAAMAVVMMLQVIMRYFFASPLPWPEELSRYLLVTSCFFGASYIMRDGFLIRMDVVLNLLPKAAGRILDGLGRVVTVAFFAASTMVSATMVADCYRNGLTAAALPMPLWVLYAVMCFGFFLTTVRGAVSFLRWLKPAEKEASIKGGSAV